jgi:mono/diheme cytochrome c family protein
MNMLRNFRRLTLISFFLALGLLAGCRLDMRDQPRYEPFEASTLFADGASARPRVADTVARNEVALDDQLHTGRVNGQVADSFPFTVTVAILERGQERYNIFCTPCHGLVGDGHGIVTEYGMPVPTSFHDPALREETAGYYFTVITNGTRVMPRYASRIRSEDRWAIIAYIRALQLSQNAAAAQLSAEDLPQLEQTHPITK